MFFKTKINIVISGMKNEKCAYAVRTALEKLRLVIKVEVDVEKGCADVTLQKPGIAAETFYKIIEDSGYKVEGFNNFKYNAKAGA